MIFAGIDAGIINFAIVAIDDTGKVIFVHMLQNTIRSMARDKEYQRANYYRMIRKILKHIKPDAIMIETYNVRTGFGTSNTEYVNLMLGALLMWCDHVGISTTCQMASSWKNSCEQHYVRHGWVPEKTHKRKRGALNDLYKGAKTVRVPPHMVDALCLATYLRQGKTMKDVDWYGLRQNIMLMSKIARPQHLLPLKRKSSKA